MLYNTIHMLLQPPPIHTFAKFTCKWSTTTTLYTLFYIFHQKQFNWIIIIIIILIICSQILDFLFNINTARIVINYDFCFSRQSYGSFLIYMQCRRNKYLTLSIHLLIIFMSLTYQQIDIYRYKFSNYYNKNYTIYIQSATEIMSKPSENKKKTLNLPKNLTKTQQSNKLSEDMENEIKDAFNFYDTDKKGLIARNNLRSILGNFAFSKMNGKEIQEQISDIYDNKDQFTLQETIQIITKKWFEGKGREAEAEQMFSLFDRKEKGGVGLSEIKHVFNQYLDINISDADILQFIEEADGDKKGYLNKQEFFSKLGYN